MNKLNTVLLTGLGLFTGAIILKALAQPKLTYFKPSEFGAWYPLMNPKQLKALDRFRELMGSPVFISPVEGGIGRHGGDVNRSQHNVDKWGQVNATDVFPTVPANNAKGWKYITTQAERQLVLANARKAGFTGIGLYTDTFPGNMLHGDVREDRTKADPALWSRVNHEYYSISEVV